MTAAEVPLWRRLRARALAESWALRWRLRYRPGRARHGWEAARACAGLPVDVFFDQRNQSAAVRVCESCPVRQDCLHDAWHVESVSPELTVEGVRGGLLGIERTRILASRRERGTAA